MTNGRLMVEKGLREILGEEGCWWLHGASAFRSCLPQNSQIMRTSEGR